MASSVREFLTDRSGKRQTGEVTVGDRKIKVQQLTFAEQSSINRAFYGEDGKDTRDNAYQLRQALFVARCVLEDDGKTRAFTDDEKDLHILINLMGQDMDAFNEKIRNLSFAAVETQKKN